MWIGGIQVPVSGLRYPELIVTNEKRNFHTAHTTVGCRIMESSWLALHAGHYRNIPEFHFKLNALPYIGSKPVFSKPSYNKMQNRCCAETRSISFYMQKFSFILHIVSDLLASGGK
jgi:hypothetical protein